MTTQQIETKTLAPYKKQASLIIEKANELSIKTEKEIKLASDVLSEIGIAEKRVKEERERLTKPAQDIIKWARAVFNPIENQYREAERITKNKMLVFNEKQQVIANKKLKKISEKVASGDLDIDKASEKIEGLAPVKSYKGDVGAIQFKNIKKIYIIDENKIPRKYLTPNNALIRQEILNGVKIPGIELRIEKIVSKEKV